MAKGKIVDSVRDTLVVGLSIIESAQNEIAWLFPPAMVVFAAQYGIPTKTRKLIQNGGIVKSIFQISSPYIEFARALVDSGENLRHIDQYEGVFFLVGDKTQSISSMHVDVAHLSLDDKVAAFWSESPTYAEYLLSHFDQAWARGVDGLERIRKLQGQDS